MHDAAWTETRLQLRRVATHLLARRRHAVSGRFGLRATPGGIGTPAFGPADAVEVVRVAGNMLVHEVGSTLRVVPMAGATLAGLAELVGVDLSADFSVGRDTPDLGDVDAPLVLDADLVAGITDCYAFGWRALDNVAGQARSAAPIQLWPEHFDASCLVAVGPGENDRCDLGVSPGDDQHEDPYLYVSPWVARRPGDAAYWNASFGALVPLAPTTTTADAVAFYREALSRLVE
jgi:hypothetical protein